MYSSRRLDRNALLAHETTFVARNLFFISVEGAGQPLLHGNGKPRALVGFSA